MKTAEIFSKTHEIFSWEAEIFSREAAREAAGHCFIFSHELF